MHVCCWWTHSLLRDVRCRCVWENSESGLFFVINPRQRCTCLVNVHFICHGLNLLGVAGWIWTDISMSPCGWLKDILWLSLASWHFLYDKRSVISPHCTYITSLPLSTSSLSLIDALLTDAGLMKPFVDASKVNLKQSTKSLLINASAEKPNHVNEWMYVWVNKLTLTLTFVFQKGFNPTACFVFPTVTIQIIHPPALH